VQVTPLSGRGKSRVAPGSGIIHLAGGGSVTTGGESADQVGGAPVIVHFHLQAIDTRDLQERLAETKVQRQIAETIEGAINTKGSMRRAVSKAARSQL
jgi:hypothetical protein